MKGILIESQYLPPVSYFTLIHQYPSVTVEKYEHYEKQTYRNRCYINSAQGPVSLTVPVLHDGSKIPMKDVRIDYRQKWLNNHWRTLISAYGNAPFFEYYAPELEKVLYRKPAFLYELNFSILTLCLSWLKSNIPVSETSLYEKAPQPDTADFRSVLNPKKPDQCNSFFRNERYNQVFGSKFVTNLSIVDLVFCEGPGAMKIIRASAVK